MKTGCGKSGIELRLRYYTLVKYRGLNDDQRCELKDHHASSGYTRLSNKFESPKQLKQGVGR